MKIEVNINDIQIQLKSEFEYLHLHKEEYNFIFTEVEKKITNLHPINEKEYKKYFKKILKKYILAEYDNDFSKNYFLNFFNKYISTKTQEDIEYIKDIIKLLNKIDVSPSLEFLLNFIKNNNHIQIIFQNIIDNNLELIKNNRTEVLCDDDLFIQLIDAYCAYKGISHDEEEIIEFDTDNITPENQFLLTIRKKPLLSSDEELELLKKASEGDEKARQKLIEHNLRLVLKIAGKYATQSLTVLDLLNEGTFGLMKAIDKFDCNSGLKLSTYATWWIRQAITRTVADTGSNIRLPVWLTEKRKKYFATFNRLTREYDREPTIEEVAKELGWEVQTVASMLSLPNVSTSLNKRISDDDEAELGDFIASENANLDDIVEETNLSEKIHELLKNSKLTDREILVLTHRMGLDGSKEKTLVEIGKIVGVTRERIRQIEKTALKKLRRDRRMKEFAVYMQNPEQALQNLKDINKLGYKPIDYLIEHEGTTSKQMPTNDIAKSTEEYDKKIVTTEKLNESKNESEIEIPKTVMLPSTEVTPNKKESANTLVRNVIIKTKDTQDTNIKIEEKIKMKKRSQKSLESVFEYFKDEYTYEEILEMVKTIPDKYKEIGNKKYGEDWENPILKKLSKEDTKEFYGTLLPKMKTTLKQIKNGTYDPTKPTRRRVTKTKPVIEESIKQKEIEGPKEINSEEKIPTNLNHKIIEIFNLPEFIELTKQMSIEEAVIISLRLGYIDGKTFTSKSIADFLGFKEEEVIAISKKGILLLKNKLFDVIDEEIEKISEGPKLTFTPQNNHEKN